MTPRHAPTEVTAFSLAKPACNVDAPPSRTQVQRSLRLVAGVALIGLLAACAAHNPRLSATQQAAEYKDNASGDYRPPGPPNDPWGPYIAEAARRFDVPRSWIHNVMHTESGGQLYVNGQLVTSPVGAMGLMQLMPQTYQELESEYGLGDDPYNPHDNIMAGTAYLREMYDLFGSPGFLAAYNAGPQRLNEYLTDGRPLPQETTHYVAMIQPYIQGDMPAGRSPADQFAMNSMSAPSGRPYNGGASPSLAETGGGLVSGGAGSSLAETGGGLVSGGGAHGGGSAALVAMNETAVATPVASTDDSGSDALNSQQVAIHSAQLVANGGGAVPADLMVASNDPRPTPAQVAQEEAAADNGDTGAAPTQQQAAYQPAVIEQTPVAGSTAAASGSPPGLPGGALLSADLFPRSAGARWHASRPELPTGTSAAGAGGHRRLSAGAGAAQLRPRPDRRAGRHAEPGDGGRRAVHELPSARPWRAAPHRAGGSGYAAALLDGSYRRLGDSGRRLRQCGRRPRRGAVRPAPRALRTRSGTDDCDAGACVAAAALPGAAERPVRDGGGECLRGHPRPLALHGALARRPQRVVSRPECP